MLSSLIRSLAIALIVSIALAVCSSASGSPGRDAPSGPPRVNVSGSQFIVNGEPFFSYGVNDFSLLKYLDNPTIEARREKLAAEMDAAVDLGLNTMRVYVELPQIMKSETKLKQRNLDALERVYRMADRRGIYLDLTGNLMWRPERQKRWYDKLGENARWKVQARFWRAVAERARGHSSSMSFELCSEPVIINSPHSPWYTGEFGGYNFLQVISRNPKGRSSEEIASSWVRRLKRSIRAVNDRTLITIGMFPFPGGPFSGSRARQLDFLTVHVYPERHTMDEDLAPVKAYAATGDPVVVGEIYPITGDFRGIARFYLEAGPMIDGVWTFLNMTDKPIEYNPDLTPEENEIIQKYLAKISDWNEKIFLAFREYLVQKSSGQ